MISKKEEEESRLYSGPDRKAIQRGLDFETSVAEVLDLKKQPGSGNKFYAPSDCQGHGMLVSCKSEKNITWSKVHRHWQDAVDMAYQSGSIGVLALEDVDCGGDPKIVISLSDFAKVLREVKVPEHFESKGLRERAEIDIPLLLR